MRLFVILVASMVALLSAERAEAASPTLVSVGQQSRHATAIFGPLPGVDSMTVYIATKADRASDGSFLQENVKAIDFLTADEIARGSWLFEEQVDPGTYYVMARASDFDCFEDPNCIDGYSNILELRVPKPLQRFRTRVTVFRYLRQAALTLTVTPLGESLPYRVCWTLRRGRRCVRAAVEGYSWNSAAVDFLYVSLRGTAKVTTFSWFVNARRVALKRVRLR